MKPSDVHDRAQKLGLAVRLGVQRTQGAEPGRVVSVAFVPAELAGPDSRLFDAAETLASEAIGCRYPYVSVDAGAVTFYARPPATDLRPAL